MCLQPAFMPWWQTLRDSVLQIEPGLVLFLILPRVVFFDDEEGTLDRDDCPYLHLREIGSSDQ